MCDTTMIRLPLLDLKDAKIKLRTLDLEKNIILASKGKIPKATPVDKPLKRFAPIIIVTLTNVSPKA